jgi:hypothetical protein
MIRVEHIEHIARRRLHQGEGVDAQYTRLNAARDKRRKRAQRRHKEELSGGWAQIPIIGGKS